MFNNVSFRSSTFPSTDKLENDLFQSKDLTALCMLLVLALL